MIVLKSHKLIIGFLLTVCVVGVIYLGYFHCAGWSCALSGGTTIPIFKSKDSTRRLRNEFPPQALTKRYTIDIDSGDVLMFLHIQKTGGTTFARNLATNLATEPLCYCKYAVRDDGCRCLNHKGLPWLVSRYSTSWACGVHADWTVLTSCLDDWYQKKYGGTQRRKYYYLTMLRDPVIRFISEWLHTRRGGNWKPFPLICNGRQATGEEAPICYRGNHWRGVTLERFMACPHNLGFNRQTRMLADLTLVHCYNTTAMSPARRNALLLQSAKHNLQHLAFFGLADFQTLSQVLFEHTLHIRFIHDLTQYNHTFSSRSEGNVSAEMVRRIRKLNQLDVELYQFAKDLFLQRVRQVYTEQGRPLPQQLTRLLAQEAVGQHGNSVEEEAVDTRSQSQDMTPDT